MKYEEIVELVREVLGQYSFAPTIRQVYYRLVSPPYQVIENKTSVYKYYDAQMVRAREREDLPRDAFSDTSRQSLGGDYGYRAPEEFLKALREAAQPENYTRPMWDTQPAVVEVWVEKDALAYLLNMVARKYRVPVFASRGYSPFTLVDKAVDRFVEKGGVILDFRDHDPSGLDMCRDVQDRLARYGGKFRYVPVALTYDQVQSFDLAPNPTKLDDPRAKSYIAQYGDECWELDALPPDELNRLVEEAIRQEIDWDRWHEEEEKIARDRETLETPLRKAREALEE
ncbi:hypothetical protein ES703_119731 [subsurface metagenome]